MSPTRWVVPRASSLALLAVMFGAATASAQYYDSALHSLDFNAGPLARSPRLLGMGGLTEVVPDPNTSINLWDFARIPVGLRSDDSTSTVDVRPGTDAASSVGKLPDGLERQSLAARSTVLQSEAVYRNRDSGTLFGVVGDLSGLRWDQPYAADAEVRQTLKHPQVMAVLGGLVPRILDRHLEWGAHLRFRDENITNEYRSIVSNGAGQYIDLGGSELPPPGEFAPTKTTVNTVAYGVSSSYILGRATRVALGIEHENNDILATNEQDRSASEIRESRPYWIGQAALVGKLGRSLEYGVNGIGRTSDSEQDWRFTASAGTGGIPLSGRGNLLTRTEKSSELDARVRWTSGKVILAGTLNTAAQNLDIDPPNSNDATSFNRFINEAFNRQGADTLSLPDSVVHYRSRSRAWGWGGGGSYRFGVSTLGAEFHWLRDDGSTNLLGPGPRRIAWDVRVGYEHPLGDQMTGRVGYDYRWVDQDDFTANNEYKGSTGTLGLGYAPPTSTWSLEAGYQLEFRNPDFSDPAQVHQSRQRLAAQVHWVF